MDSNGQLQLLTTASGEEEQDVGDKSRIAGDPSSLLGVLFVREDKFGCQCGSVSDIDSAQNS